IYILLLIFILLITTTGNQDTSNNNIIITWTLTQNASRSICYLGNFLTWCYTEET
ncbi:hypothetical protein ACJX0J_006516, partial [Zea mays]